MNKSKLILVFIALIFASTIVNSKAKFSEEDNNTLRIKYIQLRAILETQPLEQLKIEALKMEQYINKKSGFLIIGGLHDYVTSMKKEALLEVMSSMIIENPELLDIDFYRSVVSPPSPPVANEDKPEFAPKIGGLEQSIWSMPVEKLREVALSCEKYEKKLLNLPPIGGLVNYVRLLNNEQLIKLILDYALQYPEINSMYNLNQVEEPFAQPPVEELPIEEPRIFGGLSDYIWRQSDDVLRQWALACDKYDKENRNIHLLGGLEDYVNIVDREVLINIILTHSTTYPELNSNIKLNELVQQYEFVQPAQPAEPKEEKPVLEGGLEDYVWRMPEETLREWALTCERYQKEKNNLTLIGGLVNYVRLLHKEDLIRTIMNYANQFPELNSYVKLNELSLGYGISQPIQPLLPGETIEETPIVEAGLVDFIWTTSDDTLRQWALSCERYEKEQKNLFLLGGLVNYVRLLHKEDLVKIILDYANKYPELNSKNKLNGLALSYGLTQPEEAPVAKKEDSLFVQGGLEGVIGKVTNNKLRQWALSCEKYDREVRKIQLFGGLEDYITNLSKSQLTNIVMDYAKNYPELNNVGKLNELAVSYGFATELQNEQVPVEPEEPEGFGLEGLHDYVWALDKNVLKSFALICDRYDRQMRNINLRGGLVDYVRLLEKEALVKIILDFAVQYPELQGYGKLEELGHIYGIEDSN